MICSYFYFFIICSCNLDFASNLFTVKHSLDFIPEGIATLNEELFMICPRSPDINVYNVEPFVFQRTITVEGMNRPWDIVAGQNVLYVSEYKNEIIRRIQLPEEIKSSWTVDGTRLKLSISKNGNVIASSWEPAKIFEYTPDGTLVREIVVNQIAAYLGGLQHAVELEGDKFLVCHTDNKHRRVCIIDNTGRVIKCYGGSNGSGVGQLNVPYHLAIGPGGFILVVDVDNDRIVQLNKSLEYMNEFTGFKQPIRLRLNEELGRLYVIECDDKSITILDM